MDEKLIKYLNEVAISVHASKRYYDMWWLLRGEKRPKYVDILNQYLYLSKAMIAGTFHMAITNLFKIMDAKSYNLDSLFNKLEKDSNFSQQVIGTYKETMVHNKHVRRGVRILRNNVVSHNSEKMDYNDAFKEAKIEPKQLSEFIENLINIIEDIYNRSNISGRQFTGYAADELEIVLQSLIKFHDKKEAA